MSVNDPDESLLEQLTARKAELMELATLLADLEWLVKRSIGENKARLNRHMTPGEGQRPTVEGMPAATINKSTGRRTVVIDNNPVFLRWLHEHAPSEVEESCRDAYWKLLAPSPDGTCVVSPDGDIVDGLAVAEGDPFITVKSSHDRSVTEALWQKHRHALTDLIPELPAGGTE